LIAAAAAAVVNLISKTHQSKATVSMLEFVNSSNWAPFFG
jgi:hypothetical protein